MRRFRRKPAAALLTVAAFVLTAVNGASTAAWASFNTSSATVSATYATGTLTAPTSLHCTSVGLASVTLAWTAPTGVTTPSLLRYTVKRRQGTNAFAAIATGLTAVTYTDPGVLGTFDYVVSASYQNWTGPNSSTDTVTFAVVSVCSA